jgi:hypothetical protein
MTPESKTIKDIKAEVWTLRRKIKFQEKRLETINDRLEKVVRVPGGTAMIEDEQMQVLKSNFKGVPLDLFSNELANQEVSLNSKVKEFALTLHYYSPKAYAFMRSELCLPHPDTIRSWCSSIKCSPGFLMDVMKSIGQNAQGNPLLQDCSLIIDAMAIRKEKIWNRHQHIFEGYVDYGTACPEEKNIMAKEALVFMLAGSNRHWKHPIGYFFVDHPTGQVQAQLIKDCIQLVASEGMKVNSIIFDGCYANQTTARILGANLAVPNPEPWFPHPSRAGERVFVIMDACHTLKLMRNTIASMKEIKSEKGIIRWYYIKRLHEIQEKEGVKLGNRLSRTHVEWDKKKMNVKLAAQTLSRSVADAIDHLRIDARHPDFRGSAATTEFMRQVDRIFDMLNSRSAYGGEGKRPLRLDNQHRWIADFEEAQRYLLSLKDPSTNRYIYEGRRKTGIVGFIATMVSITTLALELLTREESPYSYVLTYRWSQDLIELFFCKIRRRGGWNNNPNVQQFRYALRRILARNTIQTCTKGANCIALDAPALSLFAPRLHRRRAAEDVVDANEVRAADDELEIEEEAVDPAVLDSSFEVVSTDDNFIYDNALYYIAGI